MQDKAKNLLEHKDFTGIEDLWMDMIEDPASPLADFFAITDGLKKLQASDRALTLLELLAGNFESRGDLSKAIDVYKQMPYYSRDDSSIRRKLLSLYRKLHKGCLNLEKFITLSGIDKAEPIFKSLARLDDYLRFDVGQYVYFENYGLGEIIEVIFERKELVIDFEKKKRHFLTFDVARHMLMTIPQEHFLYKKYKTPDELKRLAGEDPAGLIMLILRDMNQPLSASQIKFHLEGVVAKDEATRMWEKSRKAIEDNDQVRAEGKTQKTYQYVKAGIDKSVEAIASFERAGLKEKYRLAEEYAKKIPEVFRAVLPKLIEEAEKTFESEPGLALAILLLSRDVDPNKEISYSADLILKNHPLTRVMAGLSQFKHKKLALEWVRERNPDNWPEIFKNLFFEIDDPKVMSVIEESLGPYPDKLKEIYSTIFSLCGRYPESYVWLLKKIADGGLQEYSSLGYLSRMAESLEYTKGVKPHIGKIFELKNFDRIVGAARPDDAQRILTALQKSRGFAEHERKDLLRIIEYHFPQLFPKDEPVIYATEKSYAEKQKELDRLINVEIPENKKEIGRAREYGDLSENFEYKVAKERQDQLYQKIRDLEKALSHVKIIDFGQVDTSRVSIGTRVAVKESKLGQEMIYTIVGVWDSDLNENKISNESLLGKSLLGKSCGERAIVNDIEYEVMKIEKAVM